MPVRSSDKCVGNNIHGPGEMECVPLMYSLEISLRIAFGQQQLTHVIATSEDEGSITKRQIFRAQHTFRFREPLKVIRNLHDNNPGTGSVDQGRIQPNISNAEMLEESLVSLHLQALA